jgi:lipopolysaccharide/colanic/teichoic acid biosynthesis glycosyltransferase
MLASTIHMRAGTPTIFERFAALFLLAAILPALLFIGLIIGATAGGPVIISGPAELQETGTNTFRFRTTGPGTLIFHALGKLLRELRLDYFPALWNVVRGTLHLHEVLTYLKHR